MEKIAVIGLSCLLPEASDPEQFWRNLVEGKDVTSEATPSDYGIDPAIFYDPDKGKPDKTYYLRGGYVRSFSFDPTGYRLPAAFLEELDDLFKWSLHVAKEALQDSGYLGNEPFLKECGIILGNLSFPTRSSYQLVAPIYHRVVEGAVRELLGQEGFQLAPWPESREVHPHNALASGYLTSVVARSLGLAGRSFLLDAACASSLYAVKLACHYLSTGKSDLMLAGGVSCADPLFLSTGFSILQAFPEHGRSRPLDSTSEGLTVSEGAGAVVLKRYSDALRDGDRIYATIRGAGLSNDGRGTHLLTPNPMGQIRAFERAYDSEGVDPKSVAYVECHATGTPVGDVAELNSMDAFFGRHGAAPLIGSVKSNVGHLLTAAGMAGLLKVILSLHKDYLPATVHLDEPLASRNGLITANRMVQVGTPWPQARSARRAAVSAFGFGGTNAHLILEDVVASLQAPNGTGAAAPPAADKIAITGMDAFFGASEGLDAFERTIYDGKQHFRPVPLQRWKGIEGQHELLQAYGFAEQEAPQGAYIDAFAIDALRTRMPPNEIEHLNQQQLLMLKVADRAVRDAGLEEGGNVAVIVAMGMEQSLHQLLARYHLSWQIDEGLARSGLTLPPERVRELEEIAKESVHDALQLAEAVSLIGNIVASRISSLWDFSGPSFTISAEENSVFKVLEVAQMLLAVGEVEAVVLGAVDLAGGVENVLLRHQLSPVNSGEPTLSFDQAANGWLVGEGAGAVVLESHGVAQQKNRRIYALIDAIGIVEEPATTATDETGRWVPTSNAVRRACEHALAEAGVRPAEIGYLEVFGSGMEEADRAEVEGLLQAYQTSGTGLSCAIGSVKTNVGHTFAASGMASLIKAALCLYHRYIPTTPGWTGPKQPELWQHSPFYVATESRWWFLEADTTKRIAAINGMGMDGAFAHIILSEDSQQQVRPSRYLEQTPFHLFPLVADTQDELLAQIKALWQVADGSTILSEVARSSYEAFQKRPDARYALALVAHNREELAREIRLALEGVSRAFERGDTWKTPLGSYFTAEPLGRTGSVALVFPGPFNSYVGLGRDLYRLFPRIYSQISGFTSDLSLGIEQYFYPRSLTRLSTRQVEELEAQLLTDTNVMLKAITAAAVQFSFILQSYFDVRPQAAFGYSFGEFSMMFALSVWDSVDEACRDLDASPLFRTRLSGPKNAVRAYWGLPEIQTPSDEAFWSTYVLLAPADRVTEVVEQEERIFLTHINAPHEVAIAGDAEVCRRVIDRLGCDAFRAPFDEVLHCDILRSEYDTLVQLLTRKVRHQPEAKLYAGTTCEPMPFDSEAIAHLIAEGLCRQLDFPRLVNRAYEDGARIFIELGPGTTCSRWIDAILRGRPSATMTINQKGVDDYTSILKVLGRLVSHRVPVNLSPLYGQPDEASISRGRLVRRVVLGGRRMADTILHETNRQRFAGLAVHLTNGASQDASRLMPVREDRVQQPVAGTKDVAWTGRLSLQDQQFNQNRVHLSQVHTTFLQQRKEATRQMSQMIQMQLALARDWLYNGITVETATPTVAPPARPASPAPTPFKKLDQVLFDEADILEFATGKIARVFGEEYAIIDTYPRRVRLPMPPYLFLSRVTKLEAERGRYEPCSIETEYDIPHDAWYIVDGQVPATIVIEASHANMFLISYLGIDLQNQGQRVYRALNGDVTFFGELPRAGDTLRCRVDIESFARAAETMLFFYSYECFVGDRLVLRMKGGAGFFSDGELEQARGMAAPRVTHKSVAEDGLRRSFVPPLSCTKTRFDEHDLYHLAEGDLEACFGPAYQQHGRNPSLRLPPTALRMIDRITSVDPHGGSHGLGVVTGEKVLDAEAWYFQCHFKDDWCIPGTLVGEGCVELLQFYMLYLGFHTHTADACFQPVPNVKLIGQSRGQITPTSGTLTYRMEVTDLGLDPRPYLVADVDVMFEGRVVARCRQLSTQLLEKASTHMPSGAGTEGVKKAGFEP